MPRTMTLRHGDRLNRGFEHQGEAYAYEQQQPGGKKVLYFDSRHSRQTHQPWWLDTEDAFTNMCLVCAHYLTDQWRKDPGTAPAWDDPQYGVPPEVLAMDEEEG